MNKYIKLRINLLILIGLLNVLSLHSQSVIVDASIDSLHIFIGEQTKLKLEVTLDATQRAILPLFPDTLVRGVEVLERTKPDTVFLNEKQRLHITQNYIITSFDSALYYIPPIEVLVDSIPYHSNALALKVYTVPVDTLNPDLFFGPKTVMRPPFVWADWAGIIWLSILTIPLVLLLIYLIIRINDNKQIVKRIKVAPQLPPHQLAMKEIERIKAEKIWQKGHSKEYYTDLTDTIRSYISRRFGFNALEMTSGEITEKLLEVEDKEKLKDLFELFQTADLVKFAKHNPLMNENDMNLVNAIEFIEQTKVDLPINPKPEPTEVTVEEKRSKRSRLLILGGIIILVVSLMSILIIIGKELFESIF